MRKRELQFLRKEPAKELLLEGELKLLTAQDAMINPTFLDRPLNKVLELIYKEKCYYLSIIDRKKRIVGVVTPSSMINLLKDY